MGLAEVGKQHGFGSWRGVAAESRRRERQSAGFRSERLLALEMAIEPAGGHLQFCHHVAEADGLDASLAEEARRCGYGAAASACRVLTRPAHSTLRPAEETALPATGVGQRPEHPNRACIACESRCRRRRPACTAAAAREDRRACRRDIAAAASLPSLPPAR